MTTDCTPVRPSNVWLVLLVVGVVSLVAGIFGITSWIVSQRECFVPNCEGGGRERIWVCGDHHARIFFLDTSKHLDEEEKADE